MDTTFPKHPEITNGSVKQRHSYILNTSNLPASVQQRYLDPKDKQIRSQVWNLLLRHFIFLFLQLTSHQTVWNYLKNRLLVRLLGTLVATIHRIWNGNSLLLVRHHQFLKLQDITVLCRAPAPNVSVSNHLKTPFLSALATLTSSLWMTLMRISLSNSQIISLLPK